MSGLDSRRLDRAASIYWEVVEASAAERRPMIDRACDGDAALQALVHRLLAVDDAALGRFLEPKTSPLCTVTRSLRDDGQGPGRAPKLQGTIGHYEIVGALGRGGSGVVYEAHDRKLDRRVAIKVLHRDPHQEEATTSAAEREARTLAALNHPAIATIHAREEIEGISFLVQELIEGRSLRDAIGEGLRPRTGIEIARDVIDALEAAHNAGVVHRDLKPENVMLTPDGRAKVLDLGIAALLGDDAATVERAGTPGYMSSDQLLGRAPHPAQDVWSFGAVLLEMATGRPAFGGDSAFERARATLLGEPDASAFPSIWPDAILTLALTCLNPEPEARPAISDVQGTLIRIQDTLRLTGDDASDGTRTNLPRDLDAFVGRTALRALLEQKLSDHPLVTLTGLGGSGKTRLAVKAAHRWLEITYGQTWMVSVASITDPTRIADAAAQAMGLPDVGREDALTRVHRHLASHDVLLLLDGCEHHLDACRSFVTALLEGHATGRVLATSRTPLGDGHEVVVPVPPLALPDPTSVAPAALAGNEAVQLYIERARQADPTLVLTEETAPTIAALCRRVEGIPLALELAAARAAVLSPQEILDRLDARVEILSREEATDPRHRSLRATLDWSYDQLDPEDQELLQTLTVFVDGFSLPAVEAVCPSDASSQIVLDRMTRLLERSWVVRRPGAVGPARYDLLDVIRQYAEERLVARPDNLDRRLRARHAEHVAAFVSAQRKRRNGATGADAIAAVERELGNIAAALDRSNSVGPPIPLDLIADMGTFWYAIGCWTEGQTRCETALARAGVDATPDRLADIEEWAGIFALGRGELEQARTAFEAALRRRRLLERPRDVGLCLRYLGDVHGHLGRREEAQANYEEAIDVLEPLGASGELAGALCGVAGIAFAQEDTATARRYFERALELARRSGPDDGEATILGNLGNVAFLEGDLEAALDHYTEARDLHQELGFRRGWAAMTANVGATLHRAGRSEEGRVYVVEALVAFREMENRLYAAEALSLYASIEVALDRPEEAAAAWSAAEALRESLGITPADSSRREGEALDAELRRRLGDRGYARCARRGRRRHWGSFGASDG